MNMQFLAIHYFSGVFGEISIGEAKKLRSVCQGTNFVCVLNLKENASQIQSPNGFNVRVMMSCDDNSQDCSSEV
jgi:hypothetical protein